MNSESHTNIIYNKEEDKCFCLLDAPNREAVEKHYRKAGLKCDWVTEVKHGLTTGDF